MNLPLPGFLDLITTLKNINQSLNLINQSIGDLFSQQYASATVASGSAVSLTSATPTNIATLSLVAGDWDVWGNIGFTANAATTATVFEGGISTTSNTLPVSPGDGGYSQFGISMAAAGTPPVIPIGMTRINITVTTNVYLVAQSTFAVNTMSAYGFIGARKAGT